MFNRSSHISDIYTKPYLEDDAKVIEAGRNEKGNEIVIPNKKIPPKKPKRELRIKIVDPITPQSDSTFQIIEKDMKMKLKRETPGKKG